LTLKVVSKACVKWATSVPILVFLGLSVLDLVAMYTTTDVRQKHRLMPVPVRGGGIINGKGELRGQPANPGSPGKFAIKTESACV